MKRKFRAEHHFRVPAGVRRRGLEVLIAVVPYDFGTARGRRDARHALVFTLPAAEIPTPESPKSGPTSHAEYCRLVGEWLARGAAMIPVGSSPDIVLVPSINELILGYIAYVDRYYRKGGEPTSEASLIRLSLRVLRLHYGHAIARDFGPLSLKTVRRAFVEAGLCRPDHEHSHFSEPDESSTSSFTSPESRPTIPANGGPVVGKDAVTTPGVGSPPRRVIRIDMRNALLASILGHLVRLGHGIVQRVSVAPPGGVALHLTSKF